MGSLQRAVEHDGRGVRPRGGLCRATRTRSDVRIAVTAYDETNTRIKPARIVGSSHASVNAASCCWSACRAISSRGPSISRAGFARSASPVAIGGFHTSGCVAMLPTLPADLVQAMERGMSLYAGGPRGGWTPVLGRPRGRLPRSTTSSKDLPDLRGRPMPYLPADRSAACRAPHQLRRGPRLPVSVQLLHDHQRPGRKSRYRNADDVERHHPRQRGPGRARFFITDDNFARNRNWEAIFDRMIGLREKEGLAFAITIQVDTLCHKIPRFIEKARRAGVDRVFIGLESINPENLAAAEEAPEPLTEYRTMLQAWQEHGVVDLRRLHPGISRPTRPRRSSATSGPSSGRCPSTSWSSSS